jgi:serine/threonine-protein kinase HipA
LKNRQTTQPVGWAHWNRARGKETITFEYDEAWLRNPDRFELEPELPLMRGGFAPSAG